MARLFAASVMLVLVAPSVASEPPPRIVVELVRVGHPGNDADDETGYGAVPYEYQIGKYEITNRQYLEFLNAVAATDTYGLWWAEFLGIQRTGTPGNYAYGPLNGDPEWLDRPVGYVSFWNACRFVNWLHNHQPSGPQGAGTTETGSYTLDGYNGFDGRSLTRNPDATWVIPTENEWYKAAYYDGDASIYYDFPTRTDVPPSNALISPDPGNNANYAVSSSSFTIGPPYYVTPVGEFENSEGPWNTFDQGGNLWEWNETVVSEAQRGVRGSSYGRDDGVGLSGLRAAVRYGEQPLYHDLNDGDLTLRVGYCEDRDLDAISGCAGDCDDTHASVYPGAPQICDGVNNDCSDPAWPVVPASEANADGDGFRICQGDCDDGNPAVHPGGAEVCNGIDDDCNSRTDEDSQGLDSDEDGIQNACDNCRFAFNPSQQDADSDGAGNSCDNCAFVSNADQDDLDGDARGNACDNCIAAHNPLQDDVDADAYGDVCDNCALDFNADQRDFDSDLEGDLCDLNDGEILILINDPNYIEWQQEAGYTSWNVYEGDLDVLKGIGVYTQAPGSNPLAERHCGETVTYVDDLDNPPAGNPKFSLVTGVQDGVEGGLGRESRGLERPNANPCP